MRWATAPISKAAQTAPSGVTVRPWGSEAGVGRAWAVIVAGRVDVADAVGAPLGEPAAAGRVGDDRVRAGRPVRQRELVDLARPA